MSFALFHRVALHRIVICRLRRHQQTRDYVERRTAEGRTMKEIIRCLKRFVASEVFGILRGGPAVRTAPAEPESAGDSAVDGDQHVEQISP